MRPALRLDGHGYSPALLRKIVTLAAGLPSFAAAAFALKHLGLRISARHIQTLTEEVGSDLAGQRARLVEPRRQRTLEPAVARTPTVVAVEVDGGRLRTRAPDCGPGVHQAQNKEDKIACLVTLTHVEHASDPQPEPPASFVCPRRVQRLVRQMAGQAADPMHEPAPADPPSTADADVLPLGSGRAPERARWSPQKLVRTCVASMARSEEFGPLVAVEAQLRDFYRAKRRAFVADGAAYNWTIQAGYFPDFEPIVDFLHVVCYLYRTAHAVAAEGAGWELYRRWLGACWQGRAGAVLAEMTEVQARVGRPLPGEELADTDPRRVLADGISYLGNNTGRMDYPRYRQQGLPTTSSLGESLVGQFNARVKSRQKFWNRPGGAEAILQVRAALLSEDDRLERYFAARPGSCYRRRAA